MVGGEPGVSAVTSEPYQMATTLGGIKSLERWESASGLKCQHSCQASATALSPLGYNFLVERLFAGRLLLLDSGIFRLHFVVRMISHDFTKYSLSSFLAGKSCAEEIGRTLDDLANLGVFRGLCSQSLFLVFRV